MSEWHVDAVRGDGDRWLIVVMKPPVTVVGRIEVEHFDHAHAVAALRTIMLRTAPDWPDTIVTDNALAWSGLGSALGLAHRFTAQGEVLALERIAKGLLSKMKGGAA